MAQNKKHSAQKGKSNSSKRKSSQKRSSKNTFFSTEHKQIFSFIGFFFSLFMLAVVLIDAGSVWGAWVPRISGWFRGRVPLGVCP